MERMVKFVRKNIVLVVCIPSLIGLHIGWTAIQNQDFFVSEEQRRPFPIIDVSFMPGALVKCMHLNLCTIVVILQA